MPAAINGMKECTKCKVTQDVSEYDKRRDGADGFRNQCKDCRKQYQLDNRDKINEKRRQRRLRPLVKETISKQARGYRQSKKGSERIKQYQRDNRETLSEKARQYRQDPGVRSRQIENQRRCTANAATGIYEIENKITGKIYVGQSKHWKRRWIDHKGKLSRGKHKNFSLQADYDEHGLDSFEHRVVEYPCDTPPDVLKERERQTLINRIREGREVYNTLRG
jgi:predicted GIY-YIG superfamily endonuclease